jgi:hypothetical protein
MQINIVVEVPDNWEQRLDMQPTIEAEIAADRWAWNYVEDGSFGAALQHLKKGFKVARTGWNGKGMYLTLIHAGDNMHQGFAVQDCIAMKTANNLMQPGWLASQNDMLATDWVIVENA